MEEFLRLTAARFLPIIALALVWLVAGAAGFASGLDEPSPAEEMEVAQQRSIPSDPALVEDVFEGRVSDRPQPNRLRTCQVDTDLFSGLNGDLSLAVATPDLELLMGIDEEHLVAPASVVKLFTAVAALRTLGSDFRFQTTVVQGSNPGEVWLVGGGDVTLTRSPLNNYYASNASLADLAQQTVDRLAIQDIVPTAVFVDTSRYSRFSQWDESWRPGSEKLGFVAPVTALQVDGDRTQPTSRLSPRSADPVSRALRWFADDISQFTGRELSLRGEAPVPEGRTLAVVESASLVELLVIMLRDSDNSLAEVIAREVALAVGASSP